MVQRKWFHDLDSYPVDASTDASREIVFSTAVVTGFKTDENRQIKRLMIKKRAHRLVKYLIVK